MHRARVGRVLENRLIYRGTASHLDGERHSASVVNTQGAGGQTTIHQEHVALIVERCAINTDEFSVVELLQWLNDQDLHACLWAWPCSGPLRALIAYDSRDRVQMDRHSSC